MFIEADDQFMGAKMGEPKPKPTKPFGYSHFPHDLGAAPIKWVEKEVNLVWSREHKDVRSSNSAREVADIQGGHFPFLEHTTDTWEALEDFVSKAWKQSARL